MHTYNETQPLQKELRQAKDVIQKTTITRESLKSLGYKATQAEENLISQYTRMLERYGMDASIYAEYDQGYLESINRYFFYVLSYIMSVNKIRWQLVREVGDINTAEELASTDKFLQIIPNIENIQKFLKEVKADSICISAFTHLFKNNTETARLNYRDALRLYQATDNQEGIANCQTELGGIAIRQQYFAEGEELLLKAKSFYQQENNQERLERVEELLSFVELAREKVTV